MTRAARSILVFGIYVAVLGALLAAVPDRDAAGAAWTAVALRRDGQASASRTRP